MADLFEGIRKTLEGKGKTIVLPEGEDVRILEAAVHLHEEGIITPILLGNEEAVKKAAQDGDFDISDIELIDPASASYFEELAEKFVERRAGKVTIEQAREQVKDVNYFGTMLLYTGRVDGLVSGAAHSTADTVRPALQLVWRPIFLLII